MPCTTVSATADLFFRPSLCLNLCLCSTLVVSTGHLQPSHCAKAQQSLHATVTVNACICVGGASQGYYCKLIQLLKKKKNGLSHNLIEFYIEIW